MCELPDAFRIKEWVKMEGILCVCMRASGWKLGNLQRGWGERWMDLRIRGRDEKSWWKREDDSK